MKANTDEMRKIANEISSLATRYQTLITNLYNKFSNMSTTKEWVGNRAQEYVEYVMLDKPEMISIGNRIKNISKVIMDDANLLDTNISKIRKDEASE